MCSHMNAIVRLFCGTTAPNGLMIAVRRKALARSAMASGAASGSASGSVSSSQALARSPQPSAL